MKYYFIAGERSGDLHTSNLAKAIQSHDHRAVMRGFGGDYMRKAGVDIVVEYREMAVMGFWEVLKNLGKIRGYIDRCKKDILQFKPDVVVLVDYGGFNKRIATFARANGIRTFFYISPKVWAWNQNRAYGLKASVDRMFVILPFEKAFFRKFDWDVDYVGNPVLDAVKAHVPDPAFLKRHNVDPALPLIALLPGSRKQELLNVVSEMGALARYFPQYQFAIAAVENLDQNLYAPLRGLPNVKFIVEDTYNLLQHSTAAVVTSGTATLETALFKVPQIVVYRTSGITYLIVRMMIKVRFISLVNLIADKEVVRELIQSELTTQNLVNELNDLVTGRKREQVLADYDQIYTTLDIGSASENAARLMVGYLKEEINEAKTK